MMRTVEDVYEEYRHLPNRDEWPISASTAEHLAMLLHVGPRRGERQNPHVDGGLWLRAAWRGEAKLLGIPVRVIDDTPDFPLMHEP